VHLEVVTPTPAGTTIAPAESPSATPAYSEKEEKKEKEAAKVDINV
jgi:hypothetical protein